MKDKVCTVVVTYNRLDLLKDAISSLKHQKYPTDIIVVNNGSNDGTKEYLDSLDGIKVIHQENVGGAGGFYTGMKYAAENEYDFAWVMDDDIIAQPDTLENLVAAYKELSGKNRVGFLCSVVYDADGNCVNTPTPSSSRNITGNMNWPQYINKGYVQVDSATFVSVFVSTQIIRELGLPIKEFFIWGDDTEYTLRISKKHPSFLIGNSKITHLRNGGRLELKTLTDPVRIKRFSKMIRNNGYVAKKHLGYAQYMKLVLAYGRQCLVFLCKGDLKKSHIALKGIVESMLFNPRISFPDNK